MRRSKHSLSNFRLSTFNMGQLVPIGVWETLPGDTVQKQTSAIIRISPLENPLFHPVTARIHDFWCPLKTLWEDFEDFRTGGEDGTDTTIPPRIAYTGTSPFAIGTLNDHLGIPDGNRASAPNYSVLPHRLYTRIWNEYYRDQQLETALVENTASGNDTNTNYALKNVSWQKDRFTTARTDTDLGDDVTIPLLGESPIYGDNMDFDGVEDSANYAQVRDSTGAAANLKLLSTAGTSLYGQSSASGTGELKADLTQATGVSINDLRLAYGLQQFQENRNIWGARYKEFLRHAFGVVSSDRAIDNPVYLGGGRATVMFSEVLATDGTNTGDLYGHGIVGIRTKRYRFFCEEDGLIMSLMSVVPKTMYADGIDQMYFRTTKEDYYNKELESIGEEEVYNRELKWDHASADDIFGYNARYDSYRSSNSIVCGEFRDGGGRTDWHMARYFASDPALNSTFVSCVPTTRVYKDTGSDQLLVQASHSVQMRRCIRKRHKPSTL